MDGRHIPVRIRMKKSTSNEAAAAGPVTCPPKKRCYLTHIAVVGEANPAFSEYLEGATMRRGECIPDRHSTTDSIRIPPSASLHKVSIQSAKKSDVDG